MPVKMKWNEMEWIESKMKLNASEWNRRKGISVCGDLYGFFFVVACFRQIFFLVVVYIIFIFCFHCCVWDFLKWIHFLMKRNRFLKNKIHVKKKLIHIPMERKKDIKCVIVLMWCEIDHQCVIILKRCVKNIIIIATKFITQMIIFNTPHTHTTYFCIWPWL